MKRSARAVGLIRDLRDMHPSLHLADEPHDHLQIWHARPPEEGLRRTVRRHVVQALARQAGDFGLRRHEPRCSIVIGLDLAGHAAAFCCRDNVERRKSVVVIGSSYLGPRGDESGAAARARLRDAINHEISHCLWNAAAVGQECFSIPWLTEGVAMLSEAEDEAPHLVDLFPRATRPAFADCREEGEYGSPRNYRFYYASHYYTRCLLRLLGPRRFRAFLGIVCRTEGDDEDRFRMAMRQLNSPLDSPEQLEEWARQEQTQVESLQLALAKVHRRGFIHYEQGIFTLRKCVVLVHARHVLLLGYRAHCESAPVVLGMFDGIEKVFFAQLGLICFDQPKLVDELLLHCRENDEIPKHTYRITAWCFARALKHQGRLHRP